MTAKFRLIAPMATVALTLASPALAAAPECTKEPKDKWLAEEAVKTKATELGYKIAEFEVEGSCYELKGKNKDGFEVETYFDPVSGNLVKEEKED